MLKFSNHKCPISVSKLAPNLPHDIKRRQRGKRGGRKRKPCNHKKIPLPALVFANARSLNNKTDELAALIDRHHAFKNASALPSPGLKKMMIQLTLMVSPLSGLTVTRSRLERAEEVAACG